MQHVREHSSQDPDDEITQTQLAAALGVSVNLVRRALREAEEAGRRVRFRRAGRTKVYPRKETLQLLHTLSAGPEEAMPEERVTVERLAAELGWSVETTRTRMRRLKRFLIVFPGPAGNRRRRRYPLEHTLKLLRREHARSEIRRQRSAEEAADYWLALARLKTAGRDLGKLRKEAQRLEEELSSAFRALRRVPSSEVPILALPGDGLELLLPLSAIVTPLRRKFWRASVSEIPIKGEGKDPDEAVLDFRVKLAESFQLLDADPSADPGLYETLSRVIRKRRHRRTREEIESG